MVNQIKILWFHIPNRPNEPSLVMTNYVEQDHLTIMIKQSLIFSSQMSQVDQGNIMLEDLYLNMKLKVCIWPKIRPRNTNIVNCSSRFKSMTTKGLAAKLIWFKLWGFDAGAFRVYKLRLLRRVQMKIRR